MEEIANMKKAMILTFSKVYNRGANMQCYALMKTLQKMGCEVEFLDAQLPIEKLNLKGRIFYWLSHFAVAPFRRKAGFKYSQKYKTYDELCKNPPKADVFVVGSDQVWNPDITNIFDPRVYFFGYINKGRKVAYAASFGKNEWTKTAYDKQIIEDCSHFDAISVREDSGVAICKDILHRDDAVCVVDPTFLLKGDDVRALIEKKSFVRNSKYLFTYLLHEDKHICSILEKISNEYGLEPKGGTTKGGLSKLLNIESVSGWLRNIDNAELVVTNSFHCMAMCILLHKQFYVIPSFPGREIRMTSLLEKLGIRDRYIANNNIGCLKERKPIDFDSVDNKLATYRNESLNFLKKSI